MKLSKAFARIASLDRKHHTRTRWRQGHDGLTETSRWWAARIAEREYLDDDCYCDADHDGQARIVCEGGTVYWCENKDGRGVLAITNLQF